MILMVEVNTSESVIYRDKTGRCVLWLISQCDCQCMTVCGSTCSSVSLCVCVCACVHVCVCVCVVYSLVCSSVWELQDSGHS